MTVLLILLPSSFITSLSLALNNFNFKFDDLVIFNKKVSGIAILLKY